jgi:hypothetical protein
MRACVPSRACWASKIAKPREDGRGGSKLSRLKEQNVGNGGRCRSDVTIDPFSCDLHLGFNGKLKRTIPKPDFDPFDRLLKPLLEEDSVQCISRKDKVQNILIFARLHCIVQILS